jgi:hypothetical protein
MPRLEYPPPWAFVLGLAFLIFCQVVPKFLLMILRLRFPIIVANICLAFLVRHILIEFKAAKRKAHLAFLFFNPFTLLTASA